MPDIQTSGFPPPVRPLRILIAEDEALNVKFLEILLKKLGHSVKSVGNGMQVIEQLDIATYDLIFMDVQMPVMDGLEATRIIRKSHYHYKDIPIVAYTGYTMPRDKELFLAAGMDYFLGKPVEIDEIKMILDTTPRR